jgi:Icc-related predicted phosphoesterase
MNLPIRILAFSDLHGRCYPEAAALIEAHKPQWIVLCGDMVPDFNRIGGIANRLEAQREFWRAHRSAFLRDGAVTTLVRGNHEIEGFADPDMQGVPDCLQDQVVRLEGIPAEFGAWGWSREWEEEALQEELDRQLEAHPKPRIYISHVPPYGALDRSRSGETIGHRPLFQHFRTRDWPEALVLCGHVHESFGNVECGGTQVVNAACGYALLELGTWSCSVLEQARLEPSRPGAWDF